MKDLQVDVTSLPAKKLIPMLDQISFDSKNSALKEKLFDWNFELSPNSIPAAIYVSWENEIKKLAHKKLFFDLNANRKFPVTDIIRESPRFDEKYGKIGRASCRERV